MQRTIMIMAGGTEGHVFPALAVAEYLTQQGWRVVWLGAKTGMEATLVPKHGYEMAWVRFSGLRGKGFVRALALPANLLVAFWQSARAILAARPDVVLGMGGSLGAQILNETVPQALALLPQGERPEVTHQAGEKNIEALRAGYASAGVQAELVAFIDDMAAVSYTHLRA